MSDITAFKKALAIVPKCAGSLSFGGSILVAYDIVHDDKKRKSIFHRIMLGLSVFDTIASAVNIFSTWPTPKGTEGVFLASGTTATCTAQGFFNEFGNMTTPLYSASLCVWYLMFLKYGWKEKDCRKYEFAFHVVPIVVGLSMAVVGLPFDLYNNAGYLCWYASFPIECEGSACTRGKLAGTFQYIHYGIIWSAIIFVTYAMISIYLAVRRQEGRAIRRLSILSNTSRRKSKAVACQATMYVCALYLTWLFTTCKRIAGKFDYDSKVLAMLMALFFPLQGFWNYLIYKRPQWLHNRRVKRAKSRKSGRGPSGASPNGTSNFTNGDNTQRPSRAPISTATKMSVSFASNPFTSNKYSMGNTYNSDDVEQAKGNLNAMQEDAMEAAKFLVDSVVSEVNEGSNSENSSNDDDGEVILEEEQEQDLEKDYNNQDEQHRDIAPIIYDTESSVPHKDYNCNEEEETSLPKDYQVPLNDGQFAEEQQI